MVKLFKPIPLREKRNIKIIKFLFFFFLILFFSEILYLKLGSISRQIGVLWLGLGLIPPFLATFFFMFLLHHNWFKNTENFFLSSIKKVFFWIIVSSFGAIWIAIFYFFVIHDYIV